MKVLVATRESQGARERDLWRGCVPGELVRPIEERCAGAPSACSCDSAFVGIGSHGLTTTATVRDLPLLDAARYRTAVAGSLTARERSFVLADRYAEELARVAYRLPEGEVVERWDEWIGLRFDPGTDGLRIDLAEVGPDPLEAVGEELDGPDAA